MKNGNIRKLIILCSLVIFATVFIILLSLQQLIELNNTTIDAFSGLLGAILSAFILILTRHVKEYVKDNSKAKELQ